MPPDPNPSPTSPSIQYQDLHWSAADGTQLAGRQWLPADPLGAVLVIHGIGDHSGRFERMATRLAEAKWAVFAPDLRGHGRSCGARGYFCSMEKLHNDMTDCLQRATSLINETEDQTSVFMYGQSFGGLLALDFALQQQPTLAGVIASSPALGIAMPAPGWKVAVGKALKKMAPRLGLKSGLDLSELSDDPQVASRARSDRYRHGKITAPAFFAMLDAGTRCMAANNELPCPALVMHGELDRITDFKASQKFATSNDQCEFYGWPDGKHELHNMTFGEQVIERMLKFLGSHQRNRSNRVSLE